MTIRGTNGYFGRAKFHAYLAELPPETIVGERGAGCSCPLTKFLRHLMPNVRSVDTTVGCITYFVPTAPTHARRHSHDTPEWAATFINHIDGRTLRDRFGTGREVTAAEALAVLDGLE